MGSETEKVPDSYPVKEFQGQLLTLIKDNSPITYNLLSLKTKRDRKTVGRHLKILKEKGFLHREGPAKGGHWQVRKTMMGVVGDFVKSPRIATFYNQDMQVASSGMWTRYSSCRFLFQVK